MRRTVHGERTIHETPWVRLRSLDVERPDPPAGRSSAGRPWSA